MTSFQFQKLRTYKCNGRIRRIYINFESLLKAVRTFILGVPQRITIQTVEMGARDQLHRDASRLIRDTRIVGQRKCWNHYVTRQKCRLRGYG